MAVTQTSQILLKLIATLNAGDELSNVRDEIALDLVQNFGNGTGAGAANMIWHDQRTLNASATEDLDLAGVLTSVFGAALTFTKVKAILIKAAAANTNNVNVQRAASNGVPLFLAASDGVGIRPGGMFLFTIPDANGVTVTADTGDLLTITNSAGSTSVTYDIYVIGTV